MEPNRHALSRNNTFNYSIVHSFEEEKIPFPQIHDTIDREESRGILVSSATKARDWWLPHRSPVWGPLFWTPLLSAQALSYSYNALSYHY